MRRWLAETYGIFEMIVASLAFWWGVRAILPWGNLFNTESRFRAMVEFLPAWAWGSVAIGLAVSMVVFSVRQHRQLRRDALGWLFGFFLFLSFAYFLSDWRSMVMLPFLHIAGVCAALIWLQRN